MVEPVKVGGMRKSDASNTSIRASQWPCKPDGYELEMVVGLGSFGIVWKAKCLEGMH